MHGITHSYHEFLYPVDENVFNETVQKYESCFSKNPKKFRPPNNRISEENIEIVNKYGMELYNTALLSPPLLPLQP